MISALYYTSITHEACIARARPASCAETIRLSAMSTPQGTLAASPALDSTPNVIMVSFDAAHSRTRPLSTLYRRPKRKLGFTRVLRGPMAAVAVGAEVWRSVWSAVGTFSVATLKLSRARDDSASSERLCFVRAGERRCSCTLSVARCDVLQELKSTEHVLGH